MDIQTLIIFPSHIANLGLLPFYRRHTSCGIYIYKTCRGAYYSSSSYRFILQNFHFPANARDDLVILSSRHNDIYAVVVTSSRVLRVSVNMVPDLDDFLPHLDAITVTQEGSMSHIKGRPFLIYRLLHLYSYDYHHSHLSLFLSNKRYLIPVLSLSLECCSVPNRT